MRKQTNQQMVVMDEGHSEPFEIIESIECTNLLDASKRNDQRRIEINTEVNMTEEKEIQTGSYISEKNNYKVPDILSRSKYGLNQFTTSLNNPLLSQISQSTFHKMSSQLIPKQKPKKKKMNFIRQNIKSVKHWSKNGESGSKTSKNNSSKNAPSLQFDWSKYSDLYNIRTRK